MDKPTNWNYDVLAKELSENHDCDEAAIPFLLEEARKRRDGEVIAPRIKKEIAKLEKDASISNGRK